MIGIPIGLLATNAGEWFIHKHILHGLGRRSKDSYWNFHLAEHHLAAAQLGGRDPVYEKLRWRWDAQTKELLALAMAAVPQVLIFPVAPFFAGTVLYGIGNYYYVHRRSHLDPEWAKKHVPWHYDHHMGRNPESNWCVTRPWFDLLVGTREPYLGTPQEAADRARNAPRASA